VKVLVTGGTGFVGAHSVKALLDAGHGVTFRPAEEALADTVRWLHEAGHISARQAGRAAA
jgi:UDP-glucose 4-epimerase